MALLNKKRYFMSGGYLVENKDDMTFDIRIYNRNMVSTIVNIGFSEYLVWAAGKAGIIDTDEFIHHATASLLTYSDEHPDKETILRTIEYATKKLVEQGLLVFADCTPESEDSVVMTQLAMHGLFLPLIKGNESMLMTEPSEKLKILMQSNSLKANFLSSSRKKTLKWIDDGKTMFSLGMTALKDPESLPIAEQLGKDVDYLLEHGFLLNYGWYIDQSDCYPEG